MKNLLKKAVALLLTAGLTFGAVDAAGLAEITVAASTNTVAKPKSNLRTATYTASRKACTLSAEEGATIYYTTDNTTPSTGSKKYTGKFYITKTTIIRAIAVKNGVKSNALAFKVSLRASSPSSNIKSATYNTTKNVTLKSSTTNADIYYTTDGSTPNTNSKLYTGAFTVSANTVIKAIAVKSGFKNSKVRTINYKLRGTSPTASLSSGTYNSAQNIILSSSDPSAKIYYTLNGATPSDKSMQYSGAISLKESATLRAIAYSNNYAKSKSVSYKYTINTAAAMPKASVAGGTFTKTQTVSLSAEAGTQIRYTTNGTTPTTASALYSTPITIPVNTTLKAVAFKNGIASAVMTEIYVIKLTSPKASKTTGSFTEPFTVTLSGAPTGASIYYTTNGSAPTISSYKYTSAIEIEKDTILKIICIQSGMTDSDVVTYEYTFKVAAPKLESGTSLNISDYEFAYLTCATDGADIYYTTNGSTPTTKSSKYDGNGIFIEKSTTVKAIAVKSGMTSSDVATFEFKMSCYKPEADIEGGTYYDSMWIYLTTYTDDAEIRYTTDGSTPTASSKKYNDMGIEITKTTTLKAIAIKSGLSNSSVMTETYKVTVSPPEPSLAASKTYEGTQYVTLTSATPDALIYYSTNGSTPSRSSANLYMGESIEIAKTTTITAYAYKSGSTQSDTKTFRYTIKAVKPTASPTTSTVNSSETPLSVTLSTQDGADIRYTTNGSNPTASSTKYTGPITIQGTTTIKAIAVKSGCTNSDVATFTYTVKVDKPSIVFDAVTNLVTITCADPLATVVASIGDNPVEAFSGSFSTTLTTSQIVTARAERTGYTTSDPNSVSCNVSNAN